MKTLKNLIMENKLYNQMLFSVREVRSTKARQFSEQGVEKKIIVLEILNIMKK